MLTILKSPHPTLRKVSASIEFIDAKVLELIDHMYITLGRSGGVGLAAPQVGHLKRLILVETGLMVEVMINPVILMRSTTMVRGIEGCLSIPDRTFAVDRSENIQVRFIDEFGERRTEHYTGLVARIVQHEIDHLDGILIEDKGVTND